MKVRLFTSYVAIVLLLEALGASVYTTILPATGVHLSMQPYQLGIAAALVALCAGVGMAIGYQEVTMDEIGIGVLALGLFAKVGFIACYTEGFYAAAAIIAAATVAAILGRIADWILEQIELNHCTVDLGRL